MGRAIRAGSGATNLGGAVTATCPAIDGNDSLQVRKASRAEASRGVRPCRGPVGCMVAGPAMTLTVTVVLECRHPYREVLLARHSKRLVFSDRLFTGIGHG